MLSPEIKLHHLLRPLLIPLLLLQPHLKVLPELIDNAIIMKPMFLIKLIEQLPLCLHNLDRLLADLEALLQHLLLELFAPLLFVQGEVALGLVESGVDGVHGEGAEQGFDDEFEVHGEFVGGGEGVEGAEVRELGTFLKLCMGFRERV